MAIILVLASILLELEDLEPVPEDTDGGAAAQTRGAGMTLQERLAATEPEAGAAGAAGAAAGAAAAGGFTVEVAALVAVLDDAEVALVPVLFPPPALNATVDVALDPPVPETELEVEDSLDSLQLSSELEVCEAAWVWAGFDRGGPSGPLQSHL